MSDVMTEQRPPRRKIKKNKTTRQARIKILVWVLSIAVWLGIVYYGTTMAKDYIDVSIKNVEQANAIGLKDINEQVLELKAEIIALRDSIKDTDNSLSSTGQLQESIDEQLTALNSRLEELEASLKLLKEAP